MGYDLSEKGSNIVGAGRGVCLNSLRTFDSKDQAALNLHSFATKLRKYI